MKFCNKIPSKQKKTILKDLALQNFKGQKIAFVPVSSLSEMLNMAVHLYSRKFFNSKRSSKKEQKERANKTLIRIYTVF